jgi:hypothetical protein
VAVNSRQSNTNNRASLVVGSVCRRCLEVDFRIAAERHDGEREIASLCLRSKALETNKPGFAVVELVVQNNVASIQAGLVTLVIDLQPRFINVDEIRERKADRPET